MIYHIDLKKQNFFQKQRKQPAKYQDLSINPLKYSSSESSISWQLPQKVS